MQRATPVIPVLARLLLTLEADRSDSADAETLAGLRVLEKLRASLSRLVGVAGFQALLVRALALAKNQAGWLTAVRVASDATLEGFEETARQQPVESAAQGTEALLAQLLGLLVTFIGEALTLRLVKEVWPEARWSEASNGTEEIPE